MPFNPQYPWWTLVVTVLTAALLTLALIPLVRKFGLVDYPSQRKLHDSATPVSGGLAIFITLAAVFWWVLPASRFVTAMGAGSLLMTLTGILDDRLKLPALLRAVIQVGACLIIIRYAGVRLEDFGRLFYDEVLELDGAAVLITIFSALGVINAFNMIDGMDGLAGSIFLVAAAGMALFATQAGQGEVLWILLFSMAAVLGFLLLNARLPWNEKAWTFLGDGGSLLLGFILAWCFIALGSDRPDGTARAFIPMTAVWLLAVPLLDTTVLIWSRWRSGRSAFAADRTHLHHAFLRAGFSVRQAWLYITLLALALACVGVLLDLWAVPDYVSFWTFIAVAGAYFTCLRQTWKQQRFLRRNFIYNDPDL